jgi:hypothetical protein
MKSRTVALMLAVLAAGAVLLALRPVSCYADGPTDVGTVKVCKTAIGKQMEWPADVKMTETGMGSHYVGGTSLTWGAPVYLYAFLAACAAALMGYVGSEWRKDRFERLLSPGTAD